MLLEPLSCFRLWSERGDRRQASVRGYGHAASTSVLRTPVRLSCSPHQPLARVSGDRFARKKRPHQYRRGQTRSPPHPGFQCWSRGKSSMNYVNGRFFLASITHHIRSTLKLGGRGGRRTWFRHRPERSFFSCEPESMSSVSVQTLSLPQRKTFYSV